MIRADQCMASATDSILIFQKCYRFLFCMLPLEIIIDPHLTFVVAASMRQYGIYFILCNKILLHLRNCILHRVVDPCVFMVCQFL